MSALVARLPKLLALILAVVMLAALGWQGYRIWQSEKQQATSADATQAAQQLPRSNQTPQLELAQVELFGTADASADPEDVDTENLPETNLRLFLRGVMAAEGDFPGSALIEDASSKTEAYLVGDDLPGNAKLRSVHANRVIIQRSGKLENLYFPELAQTSGMDFSEEEDATPTDTGVSTPAASTTTTTPPVVTTPAASEQRREEIRQRLEELRERLRSNSN